MGRTFQKHGSKFIKTHIGPDCCLRHCQIYSWVSNRENSEGQRNLYQNSMCHVGEQQSFKLPRSEKTTAADTDTVYTAQDSKCEINSILKVLHFFACIEQRRETLPIMSWDVKGKSASGHLWSAAVPCLFPQDVGQNDVSQGVCNHLIPTRRQVGENHPKFLMSHLLSPWYQDGLIMLNIYIYMLGWITVIYIYIILYICDSCDLWIDVHSKIREAYSVLGPFAPSCLWRFLVLPSVTLSMKTASGRQVFRPGECAWGMVFPFSGRFFQRINPTFQG